MTTQNQDTIMRRRLSPTERFLWAAGEVLPVNIGMTGRIHGRTTPDLLREALSAARHRHPLLAVRIADPGPWRAWLTTDGVPDPELHVVKATAPDSWARIVEQELQRPFDIRVGPLARFVLVEAGGSFDLVGIYHHLIADGLSATFVLRDLLRRIADPAADMSPVLAAPADDLLPDRRAGLGDLRAVTRRLRGSGRAPRAGRQLAYTTWRLDTPETSALLARCRAERTTVTAALSTAFARALAELGRPGPAGIAVAVDLRRLLTSSPGEALGLYATSLLTTLDSAARPDPWDLARRAGADIQQALRPEELLPLVRIHRLLRYLPRATMSSLLGRSEAKRTVFDVSLSNMRAPVPTDYGPLRLTAVYAAAHTSLSGTPLVAVFGFDGRLFCSVTSTDGPHTSELCALAMSHLRDAVSG
ncbi:condensation domain-containing protein [Kitasatospora sp. MAP5-34]|uniref:condensation domain-containing protein n=1 Tax=Kitasatospora sp. MAP5-34 TaxID=3035102 RepID=UPI0024761DB6|nr:condensation domain-containing protein [Kitasatospora sp. MAP5-34]MDH6578151.1 hypothetical protein [Kitasatospora sp. MAP5-34]